MEGGICFTKGSSIIAIKFVWAFYPCAYSSSEPLFLLRQLRTAAVFPFSHAPSLSAQLRTQAAKLIREESGYIHFAPASQRGKGMSLNYHAAASE